MSLLVGFLDASKKQNCQINPLKHDRQIITRIAPLTFCRSMDKDQIRRGMECESRTRISCLYQIRVSWWGGLNKLNHVKKLAALVLLSITALFTITAQTIDDLQRQLGAATHDSVRLKLNFLISDAAYGTNPRLAQEIGIKALDYLQSSKSPVLQIRAIQNVANRYWEDGQYDKSIALQKKSLRIADDNDLFFWAGKANHFIGLDYFFMAQYDSSLHYYQQAQKRFSLAKDSVYLSKIESHIGLVYDQMGDYERAIEHTLRSMEIQENVPGFSIISFSLRSVVRPGDSTFFNYRIEKNLQNLAFDVKRKDSFNIAQSLHSIGRDYLNMQSFTKAVSFFRRSISFYQAADFEPYWGDLADAYLKMKRYDSAIYFSNIYLNNMLDHGFRNNIAAAYVLRGKILADQRYYGECVSAFRKSLAIYESMGNRLRIAENKIILGRVLNQMGQFPEALRVTEAALSLAKIIKSLPVQSDAYELLSSIHQNLHRAEKALEALTKFHALDKELSEGEARFQVARLSFLYSLDKKEKQLKNLQQQNLLTEQKIESRNLQMTLVLSLLLVIAALGGLYYSRYRQNKKLNAQLQNNNKEKEGLLHEIHHRVKNNLQIISSLINIKARQTTSIETNDVLQQLNGRIFSMGLVHEKLYQNKNIQIIRLNEYLTELSRHLLSSFAEKENPIFLQLNCQPVEVDLDKALTCGLITNELVTNSVKYAFTSKQDVRQIAISLAQVRNAISLQISDNGDAIKPVSGNFKKSFGSRFVDQLVIAKLGGEWSVSSEHGFHVTIKFIIGNNGAGKDKSSYR